MKKYSIIILILCSWAMSLFAISCSDQESKPPIYVIVAQTIHIIGDTCIKMEHNRLRIFKILFNCWIHSKKT